MAAGTRLLHPSPPPKQTRTPRKSSSSCSVVVLHDQSPRMASTLSTASAVRPSALAIVSKERKKEEKSTQANLDKHLANVGISMAEGLPCLCSEEKPSSSQDNAMHSANSLGHAAGAAMVSREAALLGENNNLLNNKSDECKVPRSPEGTIIRSKRLLKRRSQTHKAPKNLKTFVSKNTTSSSKISKKIDKNLHPRKPFSRGPETKRFLTVREEQDLFLQIQDLMRVEEVQRRLRVQFNREPTLLEWAQSVGMSCQGLRTCLSAGGRSREKIIRSNFPLVVHLARQYQGRGLELQDLLQEGSRGLMKSFEKFNPKVGCKFSTYAYWWIRQFIRKAIFRHSRLIRLPDAVFASLKEIKSARRLCIQEGHLPTTDDIAKKVGITTKKLDKLLLNSRDPVSIHQCVYLDITFQEITADPSVENPDLTIARQLMRQQLRHLLKNLEPRERHIIQYRFGFDDDRPRTLGEIGETYGLSNERVRQLLQRALNKLKEFIPSEGLAAYQELLV